MDDFLHNLRNPNNKRFERNRNKPYDGQFRSNDRFATRDRKSLPQQQQRKPPDGDLLPAIKRLIEGLLDHQRRLADFTERTVRAAERQAEALESIAENLKAPRLEVMPAAEEATGPVAPEEDSVVLAAPSDERLAAIDLIGQERLLGRSFEQIAQALNTRGIATVSGKGQWRAQSVSRLYNTLIQPESSAATIPAGAEENAV